MKLALVTVACSAVICVCVVGIVYELLRLVSSVMVTP